MAQNTSHAVMAQRAEPADSLDFFPTPLWATRALCEWICEEQGRRHVKENLTAWDPACGQHHMTRALGEYFAETIGTDIAPYEGGHALEDFLQPSERGADWVITNPPFRLAEQFILTALERSHYGVAMLVRTAFLEGGARHRNLFAPRPPSEVLQFVERVPMHKGRLVEGGSTATAYCWIVWRKNHPQTRFGWIAPCRKKLERPGDYAVSEGVFG